MSWTSSVICAKPAPGVAPHRHRRRTGMLALAGHRTFDPAQALAMRHDADLLALGFQDRALFDVVFEHRVDGPPADGLVAAPADAVQFGAKGLALRIGARGREIFVDHAREHARCQHRGGEPGAFLVRPVHDDDGAARGHAHVVDGAHHLQPGQDAQHAVILAAGGLRVQMAADINRIGVGIGPFQAHEHAAQPVDLHGHAGVFGPSLEQAAALGVGIGQGLAVVAARNAGADLCHLHQAVPQPFAVHAHVAGRSRTVAGVHKSPSPCLAGRAARLPGRSGRWLDPTSVRPR